MTRRGAGLTAAVAALVAAVGITACSGGSGTGGSTPPSTGPTGTGSSASTGSPGSTAPTGAGSSAGSSGPSGSTGTSAPYPTSAPVPGVQNDQRSVLDALPGSAAATCGTVGTQAQLRAGSIAAGNFVTARSGYHSHGAGATITLFVIPEQMANVTGASVTITGLSGQAAARTTTSTARSAAEAWTYFSVPVVVGVAGSYRLTITAGPNRGCFDVSFS